MSKTVILIDRLFKIHVKRKQTVFDKITESMEMLAPCFIEKQLDKWDGDDYPYYSYLTKEWYATEDKAIAATIKEMKKEYKEESK